MPRWLVLVVKVIALFGVAAAALWAASESELPVDLVTQCLVFAAACVLCFSAQRSTQTKAAIFLPLVPVVQHATDYYFWQGVHRHGFPWPWEPGGAGATIGSIAPQVGQVATVSSGVLALVAISLVVWHYKARNGGVSHSGT